MIQTTDFVVIGGGIAGTSTAAALSKYGSVLVLEQEDLLATHSTGRSAAVLLRSYGHPQVQLLTNLSALLLAQAEEESSVRLLSHRRLLWVAGSHQLDRLTEMLESASRLRRLDAEEALSTCPVLRRDYVSAGALEEEAADIDVDALQNHYTRRALSNGVQFHVGTTLVSGEYKAGSWRLVTSTGVISAGTVINAAGAWADEVASALGARPVGLQPKRRTVAIAAVMPFDQDQPMVVDVDERFYFRPYGGGMLVSPGDETDTKPGDVHPEPADVAEAVQRVDAVTTLEFQQVTKSWAGLRTFAADRLPVIGADPTVPGLFWLAGQGGFGIQASPAMAVLLTSQVVDPHATTSEQIDGFDYSLVSPERFAS